MDVLVPDSQGEGQTPGGQQGGDVAAIVSQWRCVSLQYVNEANGLAEQLAVERKALQSMRAQALMLERQVETAEDQLDSERNSYAAREVSVRTQLDNLESQVAEQDRLLGLKEDMVQSAEVELQSAIRQMSNMQEMVISTDAKLSEAQAAMADRNDAIPGMKRLVASLIRLSGLDSISIEALSDLGAKGSMQEAERIMNTVEATVSEKEGQLQAQVVKCHSLEQEIMALKIQSSKDKERLSSQNHATVTQQVKIDEVYSACPSHAD